MLPESDWKPGRIALGKNLKRYLFQAYNAKPASDKEAGFLISEVQENGKVLAEKTALLFFHFYGKIQATIG